MPLNVPEKKECSSLKIVSYEALFSSLELHTLHFYSCIDTNS